MVTLPGRVRDSNTGAQVVGPAVHTTLSPRLWAAFDAVVSLSRRCPSRQGPWSPASRLGASGIGCVRPLRGIFARNAGKTTSQRFRRAVTARGPH
jgi:hypothetical protein